MSLPVFLLDPPPAPPVVGATLRLTGEEAHHAVTVRRLRLGEAVEVVDGHGLRVGAQVAGLHRQELTLTVQQVTREGAPTPRLVVVQALPKAERGELAVQMLTEVGVDVIVPWSASRSVTRWEGSRGQRSQTRWQAIAREAAKQARRSWLPTVEPLSSTAEVVARLAGCGAPVVLHEQATVPLMQVLAGRQTPEEVVLVIGPEGGITDAELAQFAAAGATLALLGPTVLRTSTASAVAAALTLAATRWSGPASS